MKQKIYTRTGDDGMTDLLHGVRVRKNDPRIEACGTLDELNAHLGLLVAELEDDRLQEELNRIQNELFAIGAAIASGPADEIAGLEAVRLESMIDRLQEQLPPQRSFILPGGCRPAAQAHVCRTVCRRAERLITAIPIHPKTAAYINRLSDCFFVFSRFLNALHGTPEKPWSGMEDKK